MIQPHRVMAIYDDETGDWYCEACLGNIEREFDVKGVYWKHAE